MKNSTSKNLADNPQVSTEKNHPPKEIKNAIWSTCFDFADLNSVSVSEFGCSGTVEEKIYACWNVIHHIARENPEWFMKYIQDNTPDSRMFEITE
jgi:hypothetical protein